MHTAIVIGATGVTGKHITRYLVKSDYYSKVVAFSRRPLPEKSGKLINHVVDFDDIDSWANRVKGDDLFSALGTTLKQAGSKQAQYKVDYTYQANVIKAAAENGVKRLFLISSPSASSLSPFFYNRMKGELDNFAAQQGFATLVYFKPSVIEGDRPDNRIGEKIGGAFMHQLADWVPGMATMRPISGEQLAGAMVNCAVHPLPEGVHTFHLGEIFRFLR